MRCVPKGWTKNGEIKATMLWDDSGTGGRRGSIWRVNSFHLLHAIEGHDAPQGPFPEIVGKKFMASEGLVQIIAGMEQNLKPSPIIDSTPNFLDDRPGSVNNPMGGGMPIPVMPARVNNPYTQTIRLTRALREANEQAEALSIFNNKSVIPLSLAPVLAYHAQAPESMAEEIAAHHLLHNPAPVPDTSIQATMMSGAQHAMQSVRDGAKQAAEAAQRQQKQAAAAASGLFKGISEKSAPPASPQVAKAPAAKPSMLTSGPKATLHPTHKPQPQPTKVEPTLMDMMPSPTSSPPPVAAQPTALDFFAPPTPAKTATSSALAALTGGSTMSANRSNGEVDLFAGTSASSQPQLDLFGGMSSPSPQPSNAKSDLPSGFFSPSPASQSRPSINQPAMQPVKPAVKPTRS
jgi:hypothetical protein